MTKSILSLSVSVALFLAAASQTHAAASPVSRHPVLPVVENPEIVNEGAVCTVQETQTAALIQLRLRLRLTYPTANGQEAIGIMGYVNDEQGPRNVISQLVLLPVSVGLVDMHVIPGGYSACAHVTHKD